MTIRNLEKLFKPASIAIFGASDRAGSVGKTVSDNLFEASFEGPIWLVNPKHEKVREQNCYPCAKDLPGVPDLAVIAAPSKHIPAIIAELGEIGTKAAVIISAGIREDNLTQPMLDAAKKHQLRIIGPNCIGIMVPESRLNASFAHIPAVAGNVAFISQSGAIISAVLDWAKGYGIGFSHVISMGDMADVDIGDMLDYLAADSQTHAIILYIEQITDARKFMSAARSAARVKPIVVIKSGKHEASAKAAFSHTGALAGIDAVYDAAFHRAGILRVSGLEELFVAVETLSHAKSFSGERLAIVTNGGGAGVLAVDHLIDLGGGLATLSEATIEKLNKILPDKWSKGNPVDIIGDATPERYYETINTVLKDSGVDALLIMNCPTALASNIEAAKASIRAIKEYHQTAEVPKTILTNWLGDDTAKPARKWFIENGYSTYETPIDAIHGFFYLTQHAKSIKAMMQTPPSLPTEFNVDTVAARDLLSRVLKDKRNVLNELESKSLLTFYDIPTIHTQSAKTPTEVKMLAKKFLNEGHAAVVVKILSNEITHKSDVNGVVLNLSTPEAAQEASEKMLANIQKIQKNAHIDGFTVQAMVDYSKSHEVIIGVKKDNVFGPIILFGAGGITVEVLKDTAIALPPLDLKLAHDLISQTQIFKLFKGYRNHPPIDLEALALTLVKVSKMIVDLPELIELDMNPLFAGPDGVVAVDARCKIAAANLSNTAANSQLAIRPYPKEWEKEIRLKKGQPLFIRPIRPEDEQHYRNFIQKIDPNQTELRFFAPLKYLSDEFIARLTQIDYARAMAFIALNKQTNEILGVSQMTCDPDYVQAEFAILTRNDKQDQGIGSALMAQLIDYAKSEGIQMIWGEVLKENTSMLKICQALKFKVKENLESDNIVQVVLNF